MLAAFNLKNIKHLSHTRRSWFGGEGRVAGATLTLISPRRSPITSSDSFVKAWVVQARKTSAIIIRLVWKVISVVVVVVVVLC
jgi:hypothetical protein